MQKSTYDVLTNSIISYFFFFYRLFSIITFVVIAILLMNVRAEESTRNRIQVSSAENGIFIYFILKRVFYSVKLEINLKKLLASFHIREVMV